MNSQTLLPSPKNANIQVEGQCQISLIEPLKMQYIRTAVILILSILLVIPIMILFYYKKPRKYLFYSSCSYEEADNLYIESKDGNFDIVSIDIDQKGAETENAASPRVFVYKQLKFRLVGSHYSPVVLDYQKMQQIDKISYLRNGLILEEVFQSRQLYGQNVHQVKIPNYFIYMLYVLFRPMFLFQYIIVTVFLIQGLLMFGLILLGASIATTTGNYIVVYLNMKKIRAMAQNYGNATVVRDGRVQEIPSAEVVPGDLVRLKKGTKLVCDCLLLQGDVFVDESSLSGENIPIRKEIWKEGSQNKESWLYDGSVIVEATNAVGYAVYTGFSSRKGRILRAILNRKHQNPDFLRSVYIYFAVAYVVAMIFYCATLGLRLSVNIDHLFVGARVLDYTLAAIPADFVIYLTIAYSWALFRLRRNGVISTMLEKTVEANRLRTACFDKTGTITEDFSKISQIFYFQDKSIASVSKFASLPADSIIRKIFGTCHAVVKVNEQYNGDQIDVEMWKASNYSFGRNDFTSVANERGEMYKILVVNQFKSHFQSMSVLVQELKTSNYYVFVKGAPEKIHAHSVIKYPQISQLLTQESFKGRRTIGLGYKQITQQQAAQYSQKDREQFLNGIQFVGITTFQNPLKKEATPAIDTLHACGIETKIISGDNISITVHIGYQVGILAESDVIVLVEGKKYLETEAAKVYDAVQIRKLNGQIQMKPRKMSQNELVNFQGFLAVDNDIVSSPNYIPTPTTRIFSRILPDNKAKIIRLIKEQYINEHKNQSFCQKLFGNGRDKVAMVGDGANDLISIQEADVGVAINGTDAVYSSAFAIENLDGFIYLCKQGKCTTTNCLEMLRYLQIANFYGLALQVMLVTQATFWSQFQLIYINFLCYIPIACLISITGPSDSLTPQRVRDNFMYWKNHVTIWGSILILVGGLLGSFFLLTKNPDYVPNQSPSWTLEGGYNPACQLVTGLFYMYGLAVPSIAFLVQTDRPFKETIFKNVPFFLLICCNFVLITVFIFISEDHTVNTWMFVSIMRKYAGLMFAINVVTSVLAFALILGLHRSQYYWGTKENSGAIVGNLQGGAVQESEGMRKGAGYQSFRYTNSIDSVK